MHVATFNLTFVDAGDDALASDVNDVYGLDSILTSARVNFDFTHGFAVAAVEERMVSEGG